MSGAGRLVPSPSESSRFGVRVARWAPGDPDETFDDESADDFDVVIVRRPASWVDRWHDFVAIDGFVAVHADSLVYWEWVDGGSPLDTGPLTSTVRNGDDVGDLVRDVFRGYQNHYASNPLFDRVAALEGYVEWATSTAREAGEYVTVEEGGRIAGFGVTAFDVDPPDVRLAGMCTHAQGRGHYRHLVSGMMLHARARGASTLRISTQVQNIAPQRTWSALGWRPIEAYDTTHLIRAQRWAECRAERGVTEAVR